MGCAATSLVIPKLGNGQENGTIEGIQPGKPISLLNDRQKTLVRKGWKILSDDLVGRGTKVFKRIFELNPSAKQLFPFRDAQGEELVKNPCFKAHASRFMQAVGAAVDNLDDLQASFAPLLLDLGRQHIHFRGLQPDYFQAFIDGMLFMVQCDLGSRYNAEVAQAWTLVFQFIVHKLREGYFAALADAGLAPEHTVLDKD